MGSVDRTIFGRWEWLFRQIAADRIQLKGKIRRSFVFDAFPCQPQFGFVQKTSSAPNISIASASESETLLHFLSRLIVW